MTLIIFGKFDRIFIGTQYFCVKFKNDKNLINGCLPESVELYHNISHHE